MSVPAVKKAVYLAGQRPAVVLSLRSKTVSSCCTRSLSSTAVLYPTSTRRTSSRFVRLAANPPTSTSTPSSFFTPSLCRIRNASTSATSNQSSEPIPTSSTISSKSPTTSSAILDWNSFFSLRTSRRRYSLASSISTAVATTGGAFYFMVEYPDVADQVTKLIPTDPFISMGIATFGATFLGWLIGPIFGNALWRLLHRSRMPEFTIKERGFFERIKKHRVNPSGASTNNPVPDFYGEKVGSVSGYRRWLKDQRAFNRKRGGNYSSSAT